MERLPISLKNQLRIFRNMQWAPTLRIITMMACPIFIPWICCRKITTGKNYLKGPDEYDQYHLLIDSGYYHQQMRNMLQLNMGH